MAKQISENVMFTWQILMFFDEQNRQNRRELGSVRARYSLFTLVKISKIEFTLESRRDVTFLLSRTWSKSTVTLGWARDEDTDH